MDAIEHFNRGLRHYDACRFDEALSEFTLAIQLAPDYSDPYTGRGFVHSVNGDYRQAVSDFNSAIRLNPADAAAWKGRADARQILGQFDEAIRDYGEAIRLDPDGAGHFHRRGDAHSALGNLPQAIEDYRQATALNPANPTSHYFLASSLARAKSYAEAIHHYAEALRIDPDLDAEVYAFYAWLLATCPEADFRDPDQAIQLARIACELTDWSEDRPLGILAAAYAAKGDFSNAVTWQTKALEAAYEDRAELQHHRLERYRSAIADVGPGEP